LCAPGRGRGSSTRGAPQSGATGAPGAAPGAGAGREDEPGGLSRKLVQRDALILPSRVCRRSITTRREVALAVARAREEARLDGRAPDRPDDRDDADADGQHRAASDLHRARHGRLLGRRQDVGARPDLEGT
jgi:hypothetical protein